MQTVTIQGPDGSTYDVQAPEGATDDQVMQYFQQNYKNAQQASQPSTLSQIGSNAAADLKDLATPFPAKITNQATDLAADYLKKGAVSTAGDIAKGIAQPFIHPIDFAEQHPVMQAINLGMLGMGGEKSGPEASVKSFADQLGDDSSNTLASVNKKLANIPENATKMEGYNQPIPSQTDVNTATQNVINAYQQLFKEHADTLNAAKTKAGLPAEKEAVDASIRRYGNQFGLDVNAPLKLADNAPQNFNPGDSVTLPSTKEGQPGLDVTYKGPTIADSPEVLKNLGFEPEMINKMTQPSFDLTTDLPGHPKGSTLSQSALEEAGYKVPDVTQKPMPYSIGAHDTPEQLNTEIGRFKQNLKYIDPQDQIKAASYFQDQINQQGVFRTDTAKGPVMGRLKGQYGDLSDIISQNSPQLQEAKSNFSDLKNNLDLLDSKIDPDKPGATQAYLKRLFVSQSPAAQDQLKQLAYLEQLTGKPVITSLFKKFAGQSFKDLVSRPSREILEAAGGIGAVAAGHPLVGAGALGVLAAQSPRILGALEANVPPLTSALASKISPIAALQSSQIGLQKPFNIPNMQSMKDKLRMAETTKFKDSKYGNR